MGEFTRIKMLLFLLQLRAIAGCYSSFTVKDGDEVTLPCENTIKDQDNCDGTTWLFNNRETSQVVELVSLGQTKSDRLNVTENCSLVIKKVTVQDFGHYHCRQFNKTKQQGPDALVNVSVVNIHERKEDDKVTLICTVLTYEKCGHTVEWLYQGNKDHFPDLKSSQSSCSATVTLTTSSLTLKTKCDESFKCNVTDRNSGHQLLCDFNPQSPCEKAVTSKKNTESIENQTPAAPTDNQKTQLVVPYWAYIIVAVGLAVLLITVGVSVRLRRNKGNETQMDNNTRQKLNPEVTQPGPETNQHMPLLHVDAEDGVAYASISYTKTTNRKAQTKDDDEGDAVTYSTVKCLHLYQEPPLIPASSMLPSGNQTQQKPQYSYS